MANRDRTQDPNRKQSGNTDSSPDQRGSEQRGQRGGGSDRATGNEESRRDRGSSGMDDMDETLEESDTDQAGIAGGSIDDDVSGSGSSNRSR